MNKRLLEQLKSEPHGLIRKQMIFKAGAVDMENYVIHGIFSTGDVDRQGEAIDQTGWHLDEFAQNPVILFGHDASQPAIGRGVGIHVNATGELEGDIKFAVNEYDFAKTIFNLYAGGYMRAFSVGFMNNVYEIDQQNDVVLLKDNTLLEISAVNVPANAGALASAKGIDLDALKQKTEEAAANDEIEKAAVATIVKSKNIETIKAAAATLQGIVAEAEKTKGLKPAKSREIPVHTLNKAIRQLLSVSKAAKKQ